MYVDVHTNGYICVNIQVYEYIYLCIYTHSCVYIYSSFSLCILSPLVEWYVNDDDKS